MELHCSRHGEAAHRLGNPGAMGYRFAFGSCVSLLHGGLDFHREFNGKFASVGFPFILGSVSRSRCHRVFAHRMQVFVYASDLRRFRCGCPCFESRSGTCHMMWLHCQRALVLSVFPGRQCSEGGSRRKQPARQWRPHSVLALVTVADTHIYTVVWCGNTPRLVPRSVVLSWSCACHRLIAEINETDRERVGPCATHISPNSVIRPRGAESAEGWWRPDVEDFRPHSGNLARIWASTLVETGLPTHGTYRNKLSPSVSSRSSARRRE